MVTVGTGKRAPGAEAMGYADCVELALEQSPLLTNTMIEIGLRRLDEADSKSDFCPSVSFRTRYLLNRPENEDKPYSLMFTADLHNPYEAYFSLKANKMITRIAMLAHLTAVSECLNRLGQGFVHMCALKNMLDIQHQLSVLTRENLNYVTDLMERGSSSALDVGIAAQQSEMARLAREKLTSKRTVLLLGLKKLLGLPDNQELELDFEDTDREVFGSFNSSTITFAEAQTNSIELRIEDLKSELFKLKILAAYAEFLPNLHFGLQTTDPLSGSEDNDGLFFSIGLDLPLWDAWKMQRNVTRQKILLHRHGAEQNVMEIELSLKWQKAKAKVKMATIELELACSQQKLARLKMQKSEISYKEGSLPVADYFMSRKKHLEAWQEAAMKGLEYEKAVLEFSHLSGDLRSRYVSTNLF